jgi:predicted kinase
VAAAVRTRLGLPLIAKDDLKEALGGVLRTSGREDSQRLGVAVFELIGLLMRELLANGTSLIVEGNFSRPSLFDGLPGVRFVQVYVSAEPAVLRTRMLERDTHRHRVHYDHEAADEVASRAEAGEWKPLALPGTLVEIDTTIWPDLEAALANVC